MALLFNAKTQELEDVPDSQAADVLRSGSHGLTEGKIEVQSPSGEIVAIPTGEAANAYDLGFTTPNRKAVAESEDTALAQNRVEHFDDPLIAGTAGFLRGATLGGSDLVTAAAGKAMGVDLQDASKTLKEVNPISSTAGEVGGAIAGSLATGGFGTQSIIKGAAEAGEAAKALGIADSTSNLLKASQIGVSAAQGVAEGGLMGAGIGLSDSILNKRDDVAEKVMMDALSGAQFGGFVGAGGGALGAYGMPALEAAASKGKELADIAGANAGKMLGSIGKKFIKDPEAGAAFQEILNDPETLRAAATLPIKELQKQAADAAKEVESKFKDMNTFGKELGEDIKDMNGRTKAAFKDEVAAAGDDVPMAMQSIKAKKDTLYGAAQDAASSLSDAPPSGHLASAVDDAMGLIKKFEASGQSVEKGIANKLYERLQYIVPDSKLLALKGQDLKAALNESLNGETELKAAKLLEEFTGDLLTGYKKTVRNTGDKLIGENFNALRNLDKTASSIYDKIPNTEIGQAFKDARAYNEVYQTVNRTLFKDSVLKDTLTNPKYFDSLNTIADQISDVAPKIVELSKMANGVKKTAALKEAWGNLNKDSKLDPEVLKKFVSDIGGDMSKLKDMSVLKGLQDEFTQNPNMTAADKLIRIKSTLGQDVQPALKQLQDNQTRVDVLSKIMTGSTPDKTFSATDWILSSILGSKGMAAYKGVKTLVNDPYTALQATSKLVGTYDKMSGIVARAGNKIADIAKSSVPVQIVVSANRSSSPEDIKKAKDTITLLNDPKSFQDIMGSKTAALSSQPSVSLAINQQVLKTAQFLQSKLPIVPEGAIGGPAPQPSAYETAKFSRYLNAVEDPIGAVNRIAAGRGTPEEIETLKTVYPKTFSDLQKSIMNGIVESGAELSYSKRIALSQMFDLSLDSTMNGDFVQKMQANIQPGGQNGGAGRPQDATDKTPRFKRRLDESVASDLQKITNGEYK